MQTWTFKMNKKLTLIIFSGLLLSSCSWFSRGEGQVIYHWERENTGVEKFARDHSECMRKAENIRLPDFRTWFYSEEVKLDIRADWHAEKGICQLYSLSRRYADRCQLAARRCGFRPQRIPFMHGRQRLLAPDV